MRVEQYRLEVFREPNGFKVDYEEINEVPFIHFTFITDKITPTLIKMLKIVDEQISDVLYEEGYDDLFSYTSQDNHSVIQLAKKFGYKELKRVQDQIIFKKSLKKERDEECQE